MKNTLLFLFALILPAMAECSQSGDTIQMAEENVRLLISHVKKDTEVILHLSLPSPEKILLTGDCQSSPRQYTLIKKTPAGWKPHPIKTNVILQCGPPELTNKNFYFPMRFQHSGTYVILIPVGPKAYYTGEIVVE